MCGNARFARFAEDSISAFGAVSFVEAAIFLVSVGVLVLVLARAEGGTFHLPGATPRDAGVRISWSPCSTLTRLPRGGDG